MGTKLTKEEFNNKLIIDRRDVRLVGDYLGRHKKTTFQCQHGHQWESTPGNIKNGNACPSCSGKKTISKQEFIDWLVEDNRGISIVGEYTNTYTKTIFQCQRGHQWESKPKIIRTGRGCRICKCENQTLSLKDICDHLLMDNRGISIVGEYTNTYTKTTFQCQHGHQWITRPNIVIGGGGCPSCAKKGFKPDKPAWIYVLKFSNYIKYGITNDLNARLRCHKRNGKYDVAYIKHYEIGQTALDWENNIKRTHGGRYVTKEQCPDGYTETLPIHLLESITLCNQ